MVEPDERLLSEMTVSEFREMLREVLGAELKQHFGRLTAVSDGDEPKQPAANQAEAKRDGPARQRP